MDYFRAIYQAGEISERALELTEQVIWVNPAHYTVWGYRQKILQAMPEYDLRKDLAFVHKLAEDNQKGYQYWRHRQWILQQCGENVSEQDIENEFIFLERMLDLDAKNYHAWTYR